MVHGGREQPAQPADAGKGMRDETEKESAGAAGRGEAIQGLNQA